MALVDFASAHPGSARIVALFRDIAARFADRGAVRAQRLALQSLLFMPQHRLDDLGISRESLVGITEIHRK